MCLKLSLVGLKVLAQGEDGFHGLFFLTSSDYNRTLLNLFWRNHRDLGLMGSHSKKKNVLSRVSTINTTFILLKIFDTLLFI